MKVVIALTLLVLMKIVKTSKELDHLESIYDRMKKIYNQGTTRKNEYSLNWEKLTKPTQIDTKETIAPVYDFIVVGSGSSGSVIASRLSEVPHWKILLLEAGKGENLMSQIPTIAPIMALTSYNWGHVMEYQPNISTGMVNNRMLWPRGRALGGTSVINYMIYTRGNKLDYDRWGSNNPGWSYQEVLPYFIRAENAKLKNGDYRYHGIGGAWGVEDIYQPELVSIFIEGGRELGYPNIDYNANVLGLGVSTVQANVFNGKRHTSARAYLHPVRKRKNLHIVTSAFVTKILIDPSTKEAFGVEYDRQGKKFRVEARREVILSAGTFHSPQLLMLAGIGPRDHLEELGIPTIEDLPVGQNLHDHLCFGGLAFLLNQKLALSATDLFNPNYVFQFLLNGTGPYTSLGGVVGIGYIKTELSQEIADIPDIELIFVAGCLSSDFGQYTRQWMNIRDDIYDALFRPLHNIPCWTIFPMLLHPKSTGYLKLASTNPYQYPLLNGNFFTDPEQQDINTLVASIRFIQKLSKTKPFQKVGSILNPNRHPGCEPYEFDSDDYWRCALRSISVTLHHQVGTVKMGPPEDPGAVVNHELKVYGVGRLRVADCSIIPFALGAHTAAPAVMVGEKAADLIKETWGEFEYR